MATGIEKLAVEIEEIGKWRLPERNTFPTSADQQSQEDSAVSAFEKDPSRKGSGVPEM